MTPTAALLQRIGWSDPVAAARLGVADGTVRQWRSGRREPPADVVAWLDRVAEAVDAVGPAPAPLRRTAPPDPLSDEWAAARG